MPSIITIRPEPGASATVEEARERGLQVSAFPLAEIRSLEWAGTDPAADDALLIGSANAIRHGGEELRKYLGSPVYAVGERTARRARRAGFRVAMTGQGGLQHVLNAMPDQDMHLLRLAAARRVPLDLPPGKTMETCVVYEALDLPMPDAMQDALRGEALVLLHSAGAAEHFRAECMRLDLAISRVRIAALGPRIAEAAGPGWAEIRHPSKLEAGALLALAAEMCQ